MESVLIAGLCSAFVLSVLEYFIGLPTVRAGVGFGTAAVAVLLTSPLSPGTVPAVLAATFLGAFLVNFAARSELQAHSRRR